MTVARYRVARIVRVTGVAVSNGTGTGNGTGTVVLTHVSAAVINPLAGKTVFSAGDSIGTATVTPTLG